MAIISEIAKKSGLTTEPVAIVWSNTKPEDADSLAADISVTSSGPILVSDYASGRGVTTLPDTIACVFTKYVLNRDLESELYSMGILSKGRYATSRVAGPGLTGGMDVNGSGMMSFGSHVVGNSTMRSSGFVSGNMTIHDFVKYGGKL